MPDNIVPLPHVPPQPNDCVTKPHASDLHILVVDDLPSVRWTIAALLKQIGYTHVFEAGNGAEALALLQSSDTAPINCIVTDWNMPVMNGLELLRRVRASADLMHLPVVMVTAESEAEQFAAATQAGVDAYLPKHSLRIGALKEALDKALIKRGLMA